MLQRKSFRPPPKCGSCHGRCPAGDDRPAPSRQCFLREGNSREPLLRYGNRRCARTQRLSLPRHPTLALKACVRRHGTCWPSSACHGTSCAARSETGFNRRIDPDLLRLFPATASDRHHDGLSSPLAAFLPRSLFPPVGVSNPERHIQARVATVQTPIPALDSPLLPW